MIGSKIGRARILRRFSKKTMSTAEFIHDRLYAKDGGYFSKIDNQLGLLKEPIPFTELFGYEDYVKMLYERYPKNAWLTPSEIFKPYYGMTVANYIELIYGKHKLQNPAVRNQPLHIIEAGAGNGSAASSILNYFKLYKPKTYHTMKYTIVEISESMIERCKKTLTETHPQLMRSGQISFKHMSIGDYDQFSTDVTFVLLLEVLDNLPHDRLYFEGGKLEQAFVEIDGDSMKEVRSSNVDKDLITLYNIWKEAEMNREAIENEDKHETFVRESNLGVEDVQIFQESKA